MSALPGALRALVTYYWPTHFIKSDHSGLQSTTEYKVILANADGLQALTQNTLRSHINKNGDHGHHLGPTWKTLLHNLAVRTTWRPLDTTWKLHEQYLGTTWDLHGQHLGTTWVNLGTTWETLWIYMVETLRQLWGNFGIALWQLWDNLQIYLRFLW